MEIAKWLVAFVALYAFGGFIADAIVPSTSRQHLWNPAWPPHAKFHNGQTMLMGIFGGSLSLYILFSPQTLTSQMSYLALVAAARYWVTILRRCFRARLGTILSSKTPHGVPSGSAHSRY
jgi:hypothetical protein